MPLYDYVCDECKEFFQKRMSFREFEKKKRQACPKCGGEGKRSISSVPTISFKGKGFYVNDSKQN